MLTVRDLSFAYGAVRALEGISLDAPAGAVTCILGRNGVGKTTLLRCLMGQLRASAGSVRLGDADLGRQPAHRRAQAGLAIVPQGREIFPRLTVLENLQVGLQARGDGLRRVPDEIIDLFPILRKFAARMGGDLSGGQQQQLAIARALVGKPKALLLDEPTEGIQPNVIDEIGDVLVRLAKSGMAVVLVEQYLDFVKRIGDGYLVMDRGRVVAQGRAADIDPDTIATHLRV